MCQRAISDSSRLFHSTALWHHQGPILTTLEFHWTHSRTQRSITPTFLGGFHVHMCASSIPLPLFPSHCLPPPTHTHTQYSVADLHICTQTPDSVVIPHASLFSMRAYRVVCVCTSLLCCISKLRSHRVHQGADQHQCSNYIRAIMCC